MAQSFSLQPTIGFAPPREKPRTQERVEQPSLLALARRGDDRLLRDIGLERADVLGPWRMFWFEWQAIREPWRL